MLKSRITISVGITICILFKISVVILGTAEPEFIEAKSFPLSRYLVARRIHPEARTMAVMHRWTIIFHIYGDYVIVDRIIASKMMTE